MARTLMDMFGGLGQGAPAFGSYSTAGGVPVARPAPASMRPLASGRVDNRGSGDSMGWGDNALFRGLTSPGVSDLLTDLGYGLLNGHDIGQALQLAGNRSLQMAPTRRDEREEVEQRKKYSELVGSWGPEYTEFANGIADGAIDPADGYWKALDFKRTRDKEAEQEANWAGNAEFLSDPALKQAVSNGSLTFAQAYEFEHNGGVDDRNISTQPQWFTDPETGEPVLGQIASDGTVVRTDTGGLQPMAPFDINQQRAAGTASGKTQAGAAEALPGASADAQRIAIQIEDLKNHPGIDEIFGKTLGIIPNQWGPTVPGTNKANAMARIEQMSGNAFLNGRQLLKGGGAITDFESKKAEAAFARLSTAQSKEEFLQGLDEFQQALDAGVAKLQVQSGEFAPIPSGSSAPMFATNPATGERLMLQNGQWVPAQ